MAVYTRNPQFKIRAVTKRAGEISFDQTHGSVMEIVTRRKIGEAAGSFQITLLPRPSNLHRLSTLTWYDIFEAMDYVEIWMWVPPGQPDRPIMRGFVDTVSQDFSIQGRQPQRVIVVAGRDYGSLSLTTKLYYVDTDYAVQVEILKKWHEGIQKLFGTAADADPDPQPAAPPKGQIPPVTVFSPARFLGTIWEQFLRPQQDAIRVALLQDALRNQPPGTPSPATIPECLFAPMVDEHERHLEAFDPRSVAQNLAPWTDIWTLLHLYQHDPWRELFFEEDTEGPRLFYRPTPWIARDGSWVQDPTQLFFPNDAPGAVRPTLPVVATFVKDNSAIVSKALSRSIATVKNYFFTYPDHFAAYATMAKTFGPLEGAIQNFGRENPYLVGFRDPDRNPEGNFRKFGFRLYEVRTRYHTWVHQADADVLTKQIEDVRKQGVIDNLRLAKAFDHGHLLEFGNVVLAGDERIRMGNYLSLPVHEGSGSNVNAKYYISGVQHHFRQGTAPNDGFFLTTCEVTRGRGHLERARLL